MSVEQLLQDAVASKEQMARCSSAQQEAMLREMAALLRQRQAEVLRANEEDLANATGKIADVMLDRLRLTPQRVEDMAAGMEAVAKLPSPVGETEDAFTNADGLAIRKVRVPLGVVAIVYESRPNVTTDAAALCIRSGNVCVLRGGSDAIRTNRAVVQILHDAIEKAGGPAGAVQLVQDTTHDSVNTLLTARGKVDLLIPRGGKGLIQAVVQGARGVPVIETGSGICHVYVHADADPEMALSVLHNAKTSRPSVCNAAEVCLVHKEIAPSFLPAMAKKMQEAGVELRLDARAAQYAEGTPASGNDFDMEYNDFVLAVGVVDSLEDAIRHINQHSTHHSEAIITTSDSAAAEFTAYVDSAAVYVNASTRFTDGGVFGMGCEMGISTQKLGARGPMGLRELTSYKYIITGKGHIRQ